MLKLMLEMCCRKGVLNDRSAKQRKSQTVSGEISMSKSSRGIQQANDVTGRANARALGQATALTNKQGIPAILSGYVTGDEPDVCPRRVQRMAQERGMRILNNGHAQKIRVQPNAAAYFCAQTDAHRMPLRGALRRIPAL